MIKRDMDEYARNKAMGVYLAKFLELSKDADRTRELVKKMKKEVEEENKASLQSVRAAKINEKGVLSAVGDKTCNDVENKTICNGNMKEMK